MKTVRKILMIFLTGGMMMSLFGCSTKKFSVDYDGCKDLFEGAEDSYKAGERVVLKYDLIATDTDYAFYLNDEKIDCSYSDGSFFVSFIMPDHDSKLTVVTRNTMIVQTQTISIQNNVAVADIWIMADTTENRRTTLWGQADIAKESYQTGDYVRYVNDKGYETYIIRMIDEDGFYYYASDVRLEGAVRIVITAGEYPMSASLEVYDISGNSLGCYEMAVNRL